MQKKNKLVVAYIVEKDEDVWKLSADSIKDVADTILVIDGNYIGDEAKGLIHYSRPEGFKREFVTIDYPYKHEDKGANGHQRNQYLDYLKKHHVDDWCLVLDADEVVDNPQGIIDTINFCEENRFDVCSPTMRHYVNNLGTEDAERPVHHVPARLFKVNPDLMYQEVEHPVLMGGKRGLEGSKFVIWHLAYAREMMRLKAKYDNHLAKSNIHSSEFLTWWYHAHLFGEFPVKKVSFSEQPKVILDYFGVNTDYMYFKDRQLEHKHWIDAVHWREFFKPATALEVGCGLGHRVFCMNQVGIKADGFDISSWVVNNNPYKLPLTVGDVTGDVSQVKYPRDLVVCYDILEHVDEKDLPKALDNLKTWTNKWILVSVPMIGDPNLMNDSTHKIFWTREQWTEAFAKKGLAVVPTPNNFLFKEQLFILEVLQ